MTLQLNQYKTFSVSPLYGVYMKCNEDGQLKRRNPKENSLSIDFGNTESSSVYCYMHSNTLCSISDVFMVRWSLHHEDPTSDFHNRILPYCSRSIWNFCCFDFQAPARMSNLWNHSICPSSQSNAASSWDSSNIL